WHALDVKDEQGNYRRTDHNNGHAQIDFASQWLLARMLVEGHGRELYHRGYQREIVRAGYPRDREVPEELRKEDERGSHDAEDIMGWMISREDPARLGSTATPLAAADPLQAIALVASGQVSSEQDRPPAWEPRRLQEAMAARGGPLYPPIHPLFFYPLGLLEPQSAYRVNQVANMLFAFLAALGIRQLSQCRLWGPMALLAILVYPGFRASINLGQNAALSLAILTWGWVLMARGRAGWGGLVWSLLSFKPVWAVAFLLVLLLTQRLRACV